MIRDELLLKVNSVETQNLLCFSHLRWDFVYQRPQHLMSRLSKQFKVYFIEEPVFHEHADSYDIRQAGENLFIIIPLLNCNDGDRSQLLSRQKTLLNSLFRQKKIDKFIAWYYTPMALKISSHLKPEMIIYDCMDELSAFKFAPAELRIMEAELFSRAHLVFTGGHNLFRAKQQSHHNIYPFPSSIDKGHFSISRNRLPEPSDEQCIQGIRFGFYGVLDERFDINLIREVAARRPSWQFVLIGPVVKINPDDLPKSDNIHYLGSKSYNDLPAYLSGWDIAMIPFEKNESTKYISPTKTPEYLAAGKPVISTSIVDVVSPYGENELVYIADDADTFITAAEKEFSKSAAKRNKWLKKVDGFLSTISWDLTTGQMMNRIADTLNSVAPATQVRTLKSVA